MNINALKKTTISKTKQTIKFLVKYPLRTFFALLILLTITILVGNILRKPKVKEADTTVEAKQVDTYQIGQAPRITVNAKIEKSGVVTLTAQTAGVVQNIYITEGQTAYAGNTIIGLSTNYQGGNAFALQSQIAQQNYQFNKDNFDTQKDMIGKRRTIAEDTTTNNDELRTISAESINRTKDMINLSDSAIQLLNIQISPLDEKEAAGTLTDAETTALVGLRSQKLSLLNGLNAAKTALDNTEYSTDDDNPPTKLSTTAKELTLKQLELEEKSLQLNLEISRLNYQLAQVNAALMYPAAPFSGRVEKIHVKVGQAINPGQPLVTFSGTEQTITAVATLPKDIAQNLSELEPTMLTIDGQQIEVRPIHIAQEATDGRLLQVVYPIPISQLTNQKGSGERNPTDQIIQKLINGQFIQASIPVGYADSSAAIPFVPIDAIYQTQQEAFINVIENDTAVSKTIELGNVYGQFVEVTRGLNNNDTIILNRNIISGDIVTH